MKEIELITENSIYKHIKEYAEKENISTKELLVRLLNNIDDLEKQNENKHENKDLSKITLEETGLFNYIGKQSSSYNRLKDNNINSLKELFELYESNLINYGNDKVNDNYYINDETKGIIQLLRYKYLKIESDELTETLNYNIKTFKLYSYRTKDYGFPGRVFDSMLHSPNQDIFLKIYKQFKKCGFDQTSTKALIDYAYDNDINDINLGNFLEEIEEEKIKPYFSKVNKEYSSFKNIKNILIEHHQKYNKNNPKRK